MCPHQHARAAAAAACSKHQRTQQARTMPSVSSTARALLLAMNENLPTCAWGGDGDGS
jgi:hypothetical protein